ncbi:DNA adenine methylase [Colwellia sp. E2M01]|uniref:DNA adenine methylase n=1 Tax=Colwellia sp. E2M01 TaxID=2841561 RepID=UPI001C08395A|nr:DNA adenine methylase [Colwellia sp. E2M01]MBU2870965.1 DNA adenine methylase [Colwellia sp. E2M01]
MRFIGNKELITTDIEKLLKGKNLLNKELVFFDAFCGIGAVSDYFKSKFRLKINDMIYWNTIYAQGRIQSALCNFDNLGFDPFLHLNSSEVMIKGFFYNNYSPGNSDRMYFSEYNAGRIDYFRQAIEDWKDDKLIDDNEYAYLLSSLIESISYVSNTAGVYGAFLKHWDTRAKKEIKFIKVGAKSSFSIELELYNSKVEEIIEDVECDILYLDPPYTQNQYGTQYHLLETLVQNDNPSISKVTGSRSTSPMRSDWSKNFKSHILFDKLIAKTKAKHIVFSYSVDGFLSKSFIEATLKRYGKAESYICQKISYNKYTNFKSRKGKEHFELLFYVEKKNSSEVFYESPLNYIGSKSKLVNELSKYYPKNISTFIDGFGGGANVAINANAKKVIYNELNYFVKDLIDSFEITDTYDYLMYIKRIEKKFSLKKEDSESYISVRKYYNSLKVNKRDSKMLYTMLLYGFNQQLRFNSKHEFNNPVGMRWFNDKVLEKFISFSRVIKEKKIEIYNVDYSEFKGLDDDTFVYLDPPYSMTTASYNDGKRGFNGWNLEEENRLLDYACTLNDNNSKFMISYVIEHKGEKNNNIIDWVQRNNFKIIELKGYSGLKRHEVIIINYDK